MSEFITQYIRIENNEKSYNNKKLKIKNLKNYKTHKKLFTLLQILNRNFKKTTSSILSTTVYRQQDNRHQNHHLNSYHHHHHKEMKIHNNNINNNNNNQNKNKNYYSKFYYRTNCDLYLLIPFIILIILITITNCSSEIHLNETNSINFNIIYNKLAKTHLNTTQNNKNNIIKNSNSNNYNDNKFKNVNNVQLKNSQKKSSENFINATSEYFLFNHNSNNNNNNSNLNNFVERLNKNPAKYTEHQMYKRISNNDEKNDKFNFNLNNDYGNIDGDNNDDDDNNNDFFNYFNNNNIIKNNNFNDYYYFQNFKKKNQLNSLNLNSSKGGIPINPGKNHHHFNDDVNFIEDQRDIEKLQQLVLQGLGLTKLPDVSKINISQTEYITKYNEYMLRVKERKQRELLLYNNLEYLDEIKSPKILKTFIHNSSDSNLYLMNNLYPNYYHQIKMNKNKYLKRKTKLRQKRSSHRNNGNNNYDENIDNDFSSSSHDVSSSLLSLFASSSSVSASPSEFTSKSESISSLLSSKPPTSIKNHDIVYVRFPIKIENESSSSSSSETDVEEANLRLLLIKFKNKINHSMNDKNLNSNYDNNNNNKSKNNNNNNNKDIKDTNRKHSTNSKKKTITIKVYQLKEPYERIWLDSRQIHVDIDTDNTDNEFIDTDLDKQELLDSQWLDFDVTKAVESWVTGKNSNLGLEIHCELCFRHGIRILHDTSIISNYYGNLNNDEILSPVLNIIGRTNNYNDDISSISNDNSYNNVHERGKRSRQNHNLLQNVKRKPRKTDCYEENKKCCRHTLEVVFKEIKGFEFIIQPKVFDAGYCRGKCPPRYNPAHHHALLQSLIWKQDKNKAPRPCCAPSKLVELEVLHVDEKDPKKLKVSTWTDMRALECACS